MGNRCRVKCNAILPDWSPRSPELNVLDYYFWNRVKSGLNDLDGGWPQNALDMERGIRTVVDGISQLEINNSILHFNTRLELCFDAGGKHFEYMM